MLAANQTDSSCHKQLDDVVDDIRNTQLLAAFVCFLWAIGFAATYTRFFPAIKKSYDYGVLIFLLTFNLITVSSYRQQDVVSLTRDRLSTIAIGCAICLFMSLLVLPNWSGEDLHSSTVGKFQGLATSIEGGCLASTVYLIDYYYY